jgi:hypothetical protein
MTIGFASESLLPSNFVCIFLKKKTPPDAGIPKHGHGQKHNMCGPFLNRTLDGSKTRSIILLLCVNKKQIPSDICGCTDKAMLVFG